MQHLDGDDPGRRRADDDEARIPHGAGHVAERREHARVAAALWSPSTAGQVAPRARRGAHSRGRAAPGAAGCRCATTTAPPTGQRGEDDEDGQGRPHPDQREDEDDDHRGDDRGRPPTPAAHTIAAPSRAGIG